jgi:hypothetical protein
MIVRFSPAFDKAFSKLSTDDQELSIDMIELFKEFKTRHPEYKKSTHGYSSNNSLEIKKNR